MGGQLWEAFAPMVPGYASPILVVSNPASFDFLSGFLVAVPKWQPKWGPLPVKPSSTSWTCLKPSEGQGKQDLFPERSQDCVCHHTRHQMMMWSPAVEKYLHPVFPINDGGQPVKINASTPRSRPISGPLITSSWLLALKNVFTPYFLLMGLQEGN
jgi:hypothetical protein